MTSKHKVYMHMAFFWMALVINFPIQGLAQSGENQIIAGFAFSLVPVHLLCQGLLLFVKKHAPFIRLIVVSALLTLTSFFFMALEWGSFTVKAMPLSLASAFALLYTAYCLVRESKGRVLHKVTAFVLFVFAVHGMNFSFFRENPDNQVWGWMVAYALYQALAALLPAITLVEYNREEKARLRAIIDKKTKALKEANQELASSVGFKEFLFRTLSHDISTPLMIAERSIEIASQSVSAELPHSQLLDKAQCSLKKMSNIVKDLRSLESKSPKLSMVSLFECVERALSDLDIMIKAKEIDVDHSDEVLQKCFVNVHTSSFVNSVLTNVLRNSIKFSSKGSQIRFYARVESDMVHFWIVDQGIGIPSQILDHIFDFSSETSRPGTEGEAGTGWGLPIAHSVVRSYGGEITVQSKEADGQEAGETRVLISLLGGVIADSNQNVIDFRKNNPLHVEVPSSRAS